MSFSASGTIEIKANETVSLSTSNLAGELVEFDGPGAVLIAGHLGGATIAGFNFGDTIELSEDANRAVVVGANLTLTLGSLHVDTATLEGSYQSSDFDVLSIGSSGIGATEVLHAPCFAAGTRIATPAGEKSVEELRPGDNLRLARGGVAPAVWVGQCEIDVARHALPRAVWPVLIVAGAFAPGRPRRDLWLSPDHAVFAEGALIPVRYLCNGTTVRQVPRDRVTYFHIELARHTVLLAEGLPTESYLDTGNRDAFGGLFPTPKTRKVPRGCAPLLSRGPQVVAIRRRLLLRAVALGFRVNDDPDLQVLAGGRVLDVVGRGRRRTVTLPPDAAAIRLRSRGWTPAEFLGGDDDRRLGVAISRLTLDGCPVALDDPRLSSGWHAPEQEWRWTDGDAGLALAGVRELAFDVAMTGRYLEPPPDARR